MFNFLRKIFNLYICGICGGLKNTELNWINKDYRI